MFTRLRKNMVEIANAYTHKILKWKNQKNIIAC